LSPTADAKTSGLLISPIVYANTSGLLIYMFLQFDKARSIANNLLKFHIFDSLNETAMFNQLLQLVEQHAGDVIINNSAIPNQQNSAAIQNVTQQIFNQLQSHASSGNLPQLISLFQNGGGSSLSNHPIVSGMITSVAGSFSSQYGIPQANAQNMASTLVPNIMNQLITKTNNPMDNSFTITSVMQSVSGNNNLNVASLLGQVTGNSGSSSTIGILGNLMSKFFK
jgi:hypothetical protein